MIYRCKVLLNTDVLNFTEHIIEKKYLINNKYSLNIEIQIEEDNFYLTLSIFDNRNYLIKENVYKFDYKDKLIEDEIINICKTYILSTSLNSDTFMLKIFNKNLSKQLEITYSEEEMKNEIMFTNLKNDFELIELSIFIIRNSYDGLETLFINKALYNGYKTLKEILDDCDTELDVDKSGKIDLALSRLIRKKEISSKNLANLFYTLAIVYLINMSHIRIISNQIDYYKDNMQGQRLIGLKPYFEI